MFSVYKLNKQGDDIQPWHTPFPILNQFIVPCPILTVASWPAYRFLEAGQVVLYSHLFQNFPQFIVINTVKGFGLFNKAEIAVFLELTFSMIQRMLAIWSLVSLPFLKPAWTSGSSQVMCCWSLAWSILSITIPACEMSAVARCCSSYPNKCHHHTQCWSLESDRTNTTLPYFYVCIN